MDDLTNNPGTPQSPEGAAMDVTLKAITDDGAVLQRERLITRLVDGVSTGEDWTMLGELARIDKTIFADLATTRAMNAELCDQVHAAVAVHSRVDLRGSDDRGHAYGIGGERASSRGGTIAGDPDALRAAGKLPPAWKLGWAVAAALALVAGWQWVGLNHRISTSGNEAINTAGILPVGNPEQALDAYYKLGKKTGLVVMELPQRYVLESRPTADGKHEVLYLRQVLERAVVDDLYRFGSDDQGRPVLVPAEPPVKAGPAL